MYAKMAFDNRRVNTFGILGFPIPNSENSNGISIVQPIKPEKINDIDSANFLDSLTYIIPLIMKYIKLVLFKKDMMEENINKIVMA